MENKAKGPSDIKGRLISVSMDHVSGFVFDASDPSRPLELEVYANGSPIGRHRVEADPTKGGRFDQAHRFRITIPAQLGRRGGVEKLGVKILETGRFMEGSPLADQFDATAVPNVTLAEISEERPEDLLPLLDRRNIGETALTADQLAWRRDGFLKLDRFFDDELLNKYSRARWRHLPHALGWQGPTPYLHVPELRRLCCDGALAQKLEELIGEPMGLHLNLTNWISTERNWHQDDYLNPPTLNSWYLAVWIALDDIHPDAGPFEYVPASHKWPTMRKEAVKKILPRNHRARTDWPILTQDAVAEAMEAEIARRGAKVERFLAKKGDVLIWHSCLVHRGSQPKNSALLRKAVIAHYSSIHRRPGFKPAVKTSEGGWYFPFDYDLY